MASVRERKNSRHLQKSTYDIYNVMNKLSCGLNYPKTEWWSNDEPLLFQMRKQAFWLSETQKRMNSSGSSSYPFKPWPRLYGWACSKTTAVCILGPSLKMTQLCTFVNLHLYCDRQRCAVFSSLCKRVYNLNMCCSLIYQVKVFGVFFCSSSPYEVVRWHECPIFQLDHRETRRSWRVLGWSHWDWPLDSHLRQKFILRVQTKGHCHLQIGQWWV